MRPALEVADIVRAHGAEFRQAHATSLSRQQKRVLRSIELCRTAALGGHLEQCDQCGHERNAYNSCVMESNSLWRVESVKRACCTRRHAPRLSIKTCLSEARVVCRGAETCLCEGWVARPLQWPRAFPWDQLGRRLPSWPDYCARATGRLFGCLALLAAPPLRRYVGVRGARLVCRSTLSIFEQPFRYGVAERMPLPIG